MKKAKISLAIILVLGTIGASLAYKANRVGALFYTETISGSSRMCTVATILPYITDEFGNNTIWASLGFYTGRCTVLVVSRDM
ncbi:hypothetical protein HGH93_29680 [Chitinophaga polysaccharea]|uniref:hypothetical protein n=1 Tax=Chitinophaga polysaccharea TaxID=1293035 RepID=UPI001454E8E2|nr:hypothetical protein [Chitinophaga polysaccharea]NLR62299.1 hypothetical protein [Chitinophaga polysaccharea]